MEEDIREWLKKSESDFDAARFNLEGKKYDVSAFLSQQAAEKALKAVYIKKFKSLLKIHDLVLLCRKLGAPKEIEDVCKTLTAFYIETRYPGIVDEIGEKEAANALAYSQKVIEWSKKNL